MKVRIPYGKTELELEHENIREVVVSCIDELKSEMEEGEIVKNAMSHPIGGSRLSELAQGKKTAVIIISDHTRPVPSRHIIPYMLSELRQGNPEIDITLLVATGCHRGTVKEELVAKLGKKIVEHEKIYVHDCDDLSMLTEIGTLPSGARLVINRLAAEADLLVAEGFIEPHFFAGYSGGRKSVLPGICARKTVLGNHCSAFIDSPSARMGVLEGNPIHKDMTAACDLARLSYIVNVVINEEKKVVAAFAGEPKEAHKKGCAFLDSFCRTEVEKKGKIVITSNGGAPLDQNVYQAVKGLTTAEAAAVSSGAVLIMCAECADGIGGNTFYQALKNCTSATQLLEKVRQTSMEETVPDQWQYQILARILEKHRVIFVTNPSLETAISEMKMEYARTLAEAVDKALNYAGRKTDILVIPNGVSVIVQAEE